MLRQPNAWPRWKLVVFTVAFSLSLGSSSYGAPVNEAQTALANRQWERAYELYKPLAIAGDIEAQYQLGFLLFRHLNPCLPEPSIVADSRKMAAFKDRSERLAEETIYWLKLATDNGHAKAPYELGQFYMTGCQSFRADKRKAVYFETLSARRGYAEAQWHVAFLYNTGQIVPKNDEIALGLDRLAAAQGITSSMLALSRHYESEALRAADSVQRSRALERAYMWASLAMSTDAPRFGQFESEQAQRLAMLLSPQEKLQAQRLATRCFNSKYKDCGEPLGNLPALPDP